MLKVLGRSFVWMMLGVLLLTGHAEAQSVTLAWDPNSEANLGGYIIGYGPSPGQNASTVDVGLATQWTVSGLTSGRTYYFRVYAYNRLGVMSAPSAEVSTTIGGGSGSSTDGCLGFPPGSGWVCLNGGWVPPDSPLLGSGSAPPPAPVPSSGECPGLPPGAGWVCLNGGWLPPDSPLLWSGPTTPTSPTPPPQPSGPVSCPGTAPGSTWVCVTGGWVPPDHPLALAAPAPAPTTPPSSPTACVGTSPGLGWVCVNGGWVPPDHPLARIR